MATGTGPATFDQQPDDETIQEHRKAHLEMALAELKPTLLISVPGLRCRQQQPRNERGDVQTRRIGQENPSKRLPRTSAHQWIDCGTAIVNGDSV